MEQHKVELERRAAERATSDEKTKLAKQKYTQKNREKCRLANRVSHLKRKAKKLGIPLPEIDGAVKGWMAEKKEKKKKVVEAV